MSVLVKTEHPHVCHNDPGRPVVGTATVKSAARIVGPSLRRKVLLDVGEHLAIAVSAQVSEPGNDACLLQAMGAQVSPRESKRVVATLGQRLIQTVEYAC